MDDLLNQVVVQVERVRAEGLALVQVLGQSGAGASAQTAADRERALDALEAQEVSVRELLESVHRDICDFDNGELLAVSGDRRLTGQGLPGSLQGPVAGETAITYYEDAEASRTIAIKGVARDLAHSLQSELAWRKTTYSNARSAHHYLNVRLAQAFPRLELPQGKRKRPPPPTAEPRLAKPAPHSPALSELLAELPGLVGHHTEHDDVTAPRARSTLRRLTCEWANGLDTVFEFAPVHSSVALEQAVAPPQEARPAEQRALDLTGIRVAWVEVAQRQLDGRTAPKGSAGLPQAESALIRELSISAQQKHFELATNLGDQWAVLELVKWIALEITRLETSRVKSDFASPLHLATPSTHSPSASEQRA